MKGKKHTSKPTAVHKGDSDQGRTGNKSQAGGKMAGKKFNAAARGQAEGQAQIRAAVSKCKNGPTQIGPTKGRDVSF